MNKSLYLNNEYKLWLEEVKNRIRHTQTKAILLANEQLIRLYWSIGTDIVRLKAEAQWGTGVIDKLSQDLKEEFPGMSGFSPTNLRYCKRFYLFYTTLKKQPQVVAKKANEIQPQNVVELDTICKLPWGHNRELITQCKTTQEALFYAEMSIQEGWSRSIMTDFIKADLYNSKGNAITNFTTTLPSPQSALARETLHDPYNFDFLTMKVGFREKELEDALISNITKMLLQLGKGFAFVGRQVEIQVSDSAYQLDLLFYHIPLKSYVVCELKAVKFQPEFVGKLNFYVTAVDRTLKGDDDNPTIGLLLCKTKDDVLAEYSLADVYKPLGISSYNINEVLPDKFKSSLPNIEEIEEHLKDIQLPESNKD